MSPGSRVPSGVCPSKGMPAFSILPPSGSQAPSWESTKVLTWVALCVQPGGATGHTRLGQCHPDLTRAPCKHSQGSAIQTSHVPSAGQPQPGQRDPDFTRALCRQMRLGQRHPDLTRAPCKHSQGSAIQTSHVPSAGQPLPVQPDPELTRALCRHSRDSAIQTSHVPSAGQTRQ